MGLKIGATAVGAWLEKEALGEAVPLPQAGPADHRAPQNQPSGCNPLGRSQSPPGSDPCCRRPVESHGIGPVGARSRKCSTPHGRSNDSRYKRPHPPTQHARATTLREEAHHHCADRHSQRWRDRPQRDRRAMTRRNGKGIRRPSGSPPTQSIHPEWSFAHSAQNLPRHWL
jgi:hypothetical protein